MYLKIKALSLQYDIYYSLKNLVLLPGSLCLCKKKIDLDSLGHYLVTGCSFNVKLREQKANVQVIRNTLNLAGITIK
jgi:hypothetical protein